MKVVVSVTAGPAAGRSFTFTEPDCFLFGRTKDARISLPDDPYVSRQHFLLEIAPPNCRVTDLESKNGTYVNGVRYGGRKAPDPGVKVAPAGVNFTALNDGDEIVVGDTRMRVLIESEPASAEETEADVIAETIVDPASRSRESASDAYMKTLVEPAPEAPNPTVAEMRSQQQTVAQKDRGLSAQISASGPLPPGEIADSLELDDAPLIPGFRIEKVLGQGGMGKVYKGVDLRSGRDVAIKALLPRSNMSFNSYRAFNREIEVTRQLQHHNIVQFLGVGKVKGAYFCVLEFVNGMDLRTYVKMRGGTLTLPEAAPIMIGVLDGLAYAHRQSIAMTAMGRTHVFKGIVHRDLKPENILLSSENGKWIPKVADFGLSKSYESAGMTDMTMAGVAGTPAYWPREQITHYRYLHPATDVFSIASVFFEILCGGWARPGLKNMIDQCRSRGRAPTVSDFIKIIGDNPMKPVRSIVPAVPRLVGEVIDRALREAEVPVDEIQMRKTLAELRYRDAGEFRDALAASLKEAGIGF